MKTKQCKVCLNAIGSDAKVCPFCNSKQKKRLGAQVATGIIIAAAIIAVNSFIIRPLYLNSLKSKTNSTPAPQTSSYSANSLKIDKSKGEKLLSGIANYGTSQSSSSSNSKSSASKSSYSSTSRNSTSRYYY